jgi:eukaryotic-like serine/threonine-protein kinase
MARNWVWIGKYLFVIVVALILGAAIGNLGLFKNATLGTPKLTAAALVQFIAYAGALALLWMLGLRAAQQLRASGGGAASLSTIVLSLATLIVVASAYVVLMRFVQPFLSRDLKPFVDWTFIAGTLAAAIWLVWALFTESEALLEAIGRAAASRRQRALEQRR